jgi:hypothetical protein
VSKRSLWGSTSAIPPCRPPFRRTSRPVGPRLFATLIPCNKNHTDVRNDGRALVGQMLAYDKHMNFVLAECEEFRTVKVGGLSGSRSILSR